LNGQRYDEDRQCDVPVIAEVGKNVEIVDAAGSLDNRELVDQAGKASDLWKSKRKVCRRDDGGHLDEELYHIDDQHSPEPRMCGKGDVQQAYEEERLPAFKAEEDAGDLAGREIDSRHDQAVEEQSEIDRAEDSHRAGCLT
jgi:hypothetical protein